jgi:hypothetical protein
MAGLVIVNTIIMVGLLVLVGLLIGYGLRHNRAAQGWAVAGLMALEVGLLYASIALNSHS